MKKPVEFEIVPGKNKNCEQVWIPSERQLYRKTHKTSRGVRYVCVVSNCRASILIRNDNCFKYPSEHFHSPQTEDKMRNDILSRMRNEMINNRRLTARDAYIDVINR